MNHNMVDDELSFRYVLEKMCNLVLKSIILSFSITNQAQQDISELVMGILASFWKKKFRNFPPISAIYCFWQEISPNS